VKLSSLRERTGASILMLLANSHEEACWTEGWALFNGEPPIADHGLAARCFLVTSFSWERLNISKEMMQRMHSETAPAAQIPVKEKRLHASKSTGSLTRMTPPSVISTASFALPTA